MRIYCTWCDAHPEHKAICPYQPKKEETVKFEVGDKVSVQGTVVAAGKSLNIDVADHAESGYIFNADPNYVTLVERPKNFEVGKKYKFDSRGSHTYMRLGDDQWFDYESETVIQDKNLDMYYLVELDS